MSFVAKLKGFIVGSTSLLRVLASDDGSSATSSSSVENGQNPTLFEELQNVQTRQDQAIAKNEMLLSQYQQANKLVDLLFHEVSVTSQKLQDLEKNKELQSKIVQFEKLRQQNEVMRVALEKKDIENGTTTQDTSIKQLATVPDTNMDSSIQKQNKERRMEIQEKEQTKKIQQKKKRDETKKKVEEVQMENLKKQMEESKNRADVRKQAEAEWKSKMSNMKGYMDTACAKAREYIDGSTQDVIVKAGKHDNQILPDKKNVKQEPAPRYAASVASDSTHTTDPITEMSDFKTTAISPGIHLNEKPAPRDVRSRNLASEASSDTSGPSDITTNSNLRTSGKLRKFESAVQQHNIINEMDDDELEGLTLEEIEPIRQKSFEAAVNELCGACHNGEPGVVKRMLERKDADVNMPHTGEGITFQFRQGHTGKGFTPLLLASYDGHTEVVKLLLETSNIDVNKGDETGFTALMMACRYGYLEIVEYLLARPEIKINDTESSNGATALMFGCQSGNVQLVKLLLEQKDIDVNVVDASGYTALACSRQAQHKNEEIEKLIRNHRNFIIRKKEDYPKLQIDENLSSVVQPDGEERFNNLTEEQFQEIFETSRADVEGSIDPNQEVFVAPAEVFACSGNSCGWKIDYDTEAEDTTTQVQCDVLPGSNVILHSIGRQQYLNGLAGKVSKKCKDGRFVVNISPAQNMDKKARRILEPVKYSIKFYESMLTLSYKVGDKVELHKFSGQKQGDQDFNGQTGTVVKQRSDKANQWYVVLDQGDKFSTLPEEFRSEIMKKNEKTGEMEFILNIRERNLRPLKNHSK